MSSRNPALAVAHLPETPLYGGEMPDVATPFGWELSPVPFVLSEPHYQDLERLGPVLWRFIQAVDRLYQTSLKGQVPGWIAALYDQGKPEHLVKYARMKRFKSHLPLVIRPDLLVREDGFALCEVDAVPGGIGFISALNHLYRESGFPVIEPETSMPQAFVRMLKGFVPEVENPCITIVLSDESADYRNEMQWLVGKIRPYYPDIHLIHPRRIELVRDRLVFSDESGTEHPIDLIYRFFELFDLPNIPKMELIQYALKKKTVACTPPFKPVVEEKLSLALLHHPVLAAFWKEHLGADDFAWLQAIVPQGWVVDPTPLPPQAVIPNLMRGGVPLQSFAELAGASQKERELVLKPSGFSELAWGSRGVTIGHDYPAEVWQERLASAMAGFGRTPYILQRFEAGDVHTVERLDLQTGAVSPMKARTRLCPYYFVMNAAHAPEPLLSGVLATHCPADKKLLHGMKDAILAPVAKSPR